MLKHIKKTNKRRFRIQRAELQPIVCGACNHVRNPTDTCPDWQCPGCGKAYGKVNAAHDDPEYSKAELRRKNEEYLQKKSIEEKTHPAVTGVGIGLITLIKGMGSACAAANPVVQGAGIAILLGSLIWGLISIWP